MAGIAVVDDEKTIREAVEESLSDAGHDITAYASAEDFESAEDSPDLIILDESMPGKNGSEFLREMREAGKGVPVCIFSASFGEVEEELAFLREMGADLMSKPPRNFGDIAEYVTRKLSDRDTLFFYTGEGVEETQKCSFKKAVEDFAQKEGKPYLEKCMSCRGYKMDCEAYVTRDV